MLLSYSVLLSLTANFGVGGSVASAISGCQHLDAVSAGGYDFIHSCGNSRPPRSSGRHLFCP